MKLSGTNAIITGASQGLGLEIARRFVAEGANIAICARDPARLAEAAKMLRADARHDQTVFFQKCDVANEQEVADFCEHATAELSPVSVLVNNAGIYGPKGPIESVDWNDWKRAMEVNLYGVVLPCRALIPHFKRQGGGKIINLSGGGATKPLPFVSAYAASKAAVVRFTETLAGELAEYRIDVNSIAPGALNTRMLAEILEAGPELVGKAYHRKAVAQKDEGGTSPELGANLCVFLASRESDGITGKLISAVWDPWKDLPSRREILSKSEIYTLRRIVPEDRGQKWS